MDMLENSGVFTAMAEKMGITLAPEAVEAEAEALLNGFMAQKKYESFSRGGYMELMMKVMMNREAYLDEFRANARRELLEDAVIKAVLAEGGFSVFREELEAEAAAMAKRQGISPDEVKRYLGEDLAMLERDLLARKARKHCLETMGK